MTTFEKFCLSLWMKIISAALCAVLAGCGGLAKAQHIGHAKAAVAVAAVDVKATKPELTDTMAPKTGSTGAVAVATPQKSLLLLTKRGCSPCQRINTQTIPALKKAGWVVEEYDPDCSAAIFVVESELHPSIITKYGTADENGIFVMPQWILCEGERVIRRSIGFKTDKQVREFWNLKACTTVKAVSSEPTVKQHLTVAPRSSGNHWSVEGDFSPSRSEAIEHLHSVHGQSRAKLNGMDIESLLRLHDALHEPKRASRGRTIRKSRMVASACPGGCPN